LRSDLASEWRTTIRELIIALGPALAGVGKILIEVQKGVNYILGVESTEEKIIKLMAAWGKAMEDGQLDDIIRILKEIKRLLHPELELQKSIDALFDPKNIGVQPVDFDGDGIPELGTP
jgi:hypothetical protein